MSESAHSTKFDALVIGAGIAGLQSALDLADQGFKIAIIERDPSIGGAMIGLSKVCPTLDCASCTTTPNRAAVAHHANIEAFTYTEFRSARRDGNSFKAMVHRKPRYVSEADCIGCRQCEYACPVEVEDEFEGRMGSRRAAYIPFGNAIPQTAVINPDDCILCGRCAAACPTNAIVLDQAAEDLELEAGTIIATTGWQLTPIEAKAEYHGAEITNVLAPTQMERLLAPQGPYGRVLRPSDGKVPDSVAYVQCAGSRDQTLGVPYCSRVCCMYAIKQAMLLSGSLPFAEITIYYMDIRAFGKGYEEFYRSAQAMGIEFIKGKVARLTETEDQGVMVRVERIDEFGQVEERKHDLVVLSLGLRPGENLTDLLALETADDGFANVPHPKDAPCRTAVDGIFVAGTATGPKDIVDTIVEAGAAATEASLYLRAHGYAAPVNTGGSEVSEVSEISSAAEVTA
jgi:heterodisulfide reductase subunit A